MRLAGEVAIVTGSTRGIGRRIARRFAAEGAKTVVTGRTASLGQRVVSEIQDKGGDALFVQCDLSEESQVRSLVDRTVEEYGSLTVLINNAAPTELIVGSDRVDGAAWDLSLDNWNRMVSQFLTVPFLALKHSVPKMIDAGYGSIVNISSIDALMVSPGLTAYATMKTAIQGLTRAVALDGAPHNIRCNCIVVGMVPVVDDDFGGVNQTVDEINFTRSAARNPNLPISSALVQTTMAGRFGEPENVAAYALFLASREAEFVTASVVPCDGGASAKLVIPDFNIKIQGVRA